MRKLKIGVVDLSVIVLPIGSGQNHVCKSSEYYAASSGNKVSHFT